jgi:RNA polymerase primary sigma factor
MASTDELLAALAAALKSKQDSPAPRAAAPKKARISHQIDDIEIHEEPSRAKRAPATDDDFELPKKRPGRPPKAAPAAAAPAPAPAAPKERKMPVRAAPHSCSCSMCPLKHQ